MEMEWLPAGAKRIEYLESTGGQWLDTMYQFASDNIQIESKFQKTGGTYFTIGDYGTNNDNRFEIIRENDVLAVLCNPSNLNVSSNANEVNILTVNYNNGSLSSVYNNETKSVTGLNSIKTNAQNILIGKRPSGSPDVGVGQYKIWYLRFFDGGSLVRYFVPVRVGQTGYLYDKVSKTLFGNSGTGSFILGPDK